MITTSTLIDPSQPGIQKLRGVSIEVYDDKRVAEVLPSLRLAHPNTLLVGPTISTERALEKIRETLRAPVACWSPTESPRLPAIAAVRVRHSGFVS